MNKFLYQNVVRPLMFQLNPEAAHEFAMGALKCVSSSRALQAMLRKKAISGTEREVFGVRFPNPVGLAAGFDKQAIALPAWEALGFGFIEIGTVTAKPQPGNPKPRIFRYPSEQVLINRMGFNNDGSEAVAVRLQRLKDSGRWPSVPVGVNLGKSKVTPLEEAAEDYAFSFRQLAAFGDYFVINVSSPNTPGLRKLQDKDSLGEIFKSVQAVNTEKKPLLVKIAPDLDFPQIEEVLTLIESHSLAGIIATNTTLDHSSVEAQEDEQGGLSGAPLRGRSTEIVKFIAERSSFPIIASGGVMDSDSALEKLDAGAALVQLYTGFVYKGPGLIREICRSL